MPCRLYWMCQYTEELQHLSFFALMWVFFFFYVYESCDLFIYFFISKLNVIVRIFLLFVLHLYRVKHRTSCLLLPKDINFAFYSGMQSHLTLSPGMHLKVQKLNTFSFFSLYSYGCYCSSWSNLSVEVHYRKCILLCCCSQCLIV